MHVTCFYLYFRPKNDIIAKITHIWDHEIMESGRKSKKCTFIAETRKTVKKDNSNAMYSVQKSFKNLNFFRCFLSGVTFLPFLPMKFLCKYSFCCCCLLKMGPTFLIAFVTYFFVFWTWQTCTFIVEQQRNNQ